MEQIAFNYWQLDKLSFKILKVTRDEVTIGVTQAKLGPEKEYYSQKDLIDLIHKIYKKYFPNHGIIVRASPYELSPALKVNSEWIKKKMDEHGIKLKDIVTDTGLNNTQLSVLINGGKPLSDAMKAMFYFYFRSKEIKDES